MLDYKTTVIQRLLHSYSCLPKKITLAVVFKAILILKTLKFNLKFIVYINLSFIQI